MIELTHLVVALTVAYLLDLPVVYAMMAGVFPDLDLLFTAAFPFVHRGILHTPVFLLVSVAVMYLATGRRTVAVATGAGLLSHLFLDTITPMGILWLFPVSTTYFSLELVRAHNLVANIGIIVYCLVLMLAWRYRSEVRLWTAG